MRPLLRVAIYARYSSDLQNPDSIEDQVILCRRLVEDRFPASDVSVYADAALTGSTMERDGLQALLREVVEERVDLVVSEGLDRISRNLEDMARVFRICKAVGCAIHTSQEGEIGELHVGLKGTMNAMFLSDLKSKVMRSHKAIALKGRFPAGRAYGYRVVRGKVDDRGNYINGLREIDEAEATVVRRIFTLVADGVPVAQVVRMLNEERVPSPSGGLWGKPSVIGARSRGSGILHNDLYRGRLVYNRTRRVVDPVTGKARNVVNPESDWIVTEVPELRIIDDDLWKRAHQERHIVRATGRPRKRRKIPLLQETPGFKARALTGLVYCGECGGMKTLGNARRYICSVYKRTRDCKNARGTREEAVAARVFVELMASLKAASGIKQGVLALVEEAERQRQERDLQIAYLQERVNRLTEAIAEAGTPLHEPGKRIREMEKRIRELRQYPRPANVERGEEDMRRVLAIALVEMSARSADGKYADPLRLALTQVIERIDLTPIPDERCGETISIKLREGGWSRLYVHIHDNWPGGSKTEELREKGEALRARRPAAVGAS